MKYRKTIIGLAFCCIYNCTYADYIRTTTNGGKNGYQVTQKTIIDGNTVIDCVDPGYEVCPTISYSPSEQPAINFAISKIGMGTLSGSDVIEGHIVTWFSDDCEMTNSTIRVTIN